MTDASDAFLQAFGAPDPATPSGLRLARAGNRSIWKLLHAEIGAGWYRDGFLYLFGEGVADLEVCLEAWSFVVPSGPPRVMLGRNAYGAILALEHEGTPQERGMLLDPFTVSYTEIPNTLFTNIIARVLPGREVPTFLDDRAYNDWRAANRVERLDRPDVLGIKVPRGLGGTLEADNLQLDDIERYYRTTAPIYADAFATASGKKG